MFVLQKYIGGGKMVNLASQGHHEMRLPHGAPWQGGRSTIRYQLQVAAGGDRSGCRLEVGGG